MEELEQDLLKVSKDLDPIIIETIKMSERVAIFAKFRKLIHEKEFQNDEIAANVLGWAYEKLAE